MHAATTAFNFEGNLVDRNDIARNIDRTFNAVSNGI